VDHTENASKNPNSKTEIKLKLKILKANVFHTAGALARFEYFGQ